MKKKCSEYKMFFINRKTKIISIFTLIISIVVLFFCYYYEANQLTVSIEETKNSFFTSELIYLIKSFAATFASIFSAAILSSLFIEVRQKNDSYKFHVSNDFILSPDFHNSLTEDKQKELEERIVKSEHFNADTTKFDMLKGIKQKIDSCSEYYYEECSFEIQCTEHDTYYEKKILKCVTIKPFGETKSIKDFVLGKGAYLDSSIPEPKFDEIRVSTLNSNQPLVLNADYVIQKENSSTAKSLKGGYTYSYRAVLNKKLNLTAKSPIKVQVAYTSFTTKDDDLYLSRVSVPCKKYSLSFTNENLQKEIKAFPFGFIDDASKTPHHSNVKNSIKVEFKDWIFPGDGVVIRI